MFMNTLGKRPVMIGPIFIHHDRSESAYMSMASHLRKHCPHLRHLKAFGTDGEAALMNAMTTVFPDATHLLCDIHMRDNVSTQLQKLKVDKKVSDMVLIDLFGKRNGNEREGSLIKMAYCRARNTTN